MSPASLERNPRILVIDDTRPIHDSLRQILHAGSLGDEALAATETALFSAPPAAVKRPSFLVDSAYQGREGLELVRRAVERGQPYALAFVDIRMPPGWDGVETTEKIWAADPALQIVLCTAYADYSWEDLASRLGESDRFVLLKKPFEAIEVLQLASALTEKWRLAQEAKGQLARLEALVDQRTAELRETNHRLESEITERQQLIVELQDTLAKVKTLTGLLPICASCKKIRDDQGYWKQVETYVAEHSDAKFSHGLCPDCVRKLYPGLLDQAQSPAPVASGTA
ncbi:MAG: response regulator, partial [Verrucomicrobia bacterium]|nr:response regulator [Verrucomicrobiota bacterium]